MVNSDSGNLLARGSRRPKMIASRGSDSQSKESSADIEA